MEASLNPISSTDRFHVAIIMDGNGRWAAWHGLPRFEGHRAGAEAIGNVVSAAPELGVRVLTLNAFSGNNWERPRGEVCRLMEIFEAFFRRYADAGASEGVRVAVIGRRDRLPRSLLNAIEDAELVTRGADRLQLRIAIDYSAQDALLEAARRFNRAAPASREKFAELLAEACHSRSEDCSVDLLIRTGGEQRLSDFLLWEIAYAELFFSRKLWPDFTGADLEEAVREFRKRDRRFGRLRPEAGGDRPPFERATTLSSR